MEVLTVDEVIGRIAGALAERAVPARGAALAFDGDGTLWRGDVGDDFFDATVALGRFLPPAIEAMRSVARQSGLHGFDEREAPDRDAGVAVAKRLFQGYLEKVVDEEAMFEVIAWMCAGWRESDVSAFARDVVLRADVVGRRHTELVAIVEWARGAGVETFLVSASPRPVVEAAAHTIGAHFDRDHILAATALYVDGVMQPDVVRPIPYGPGKAALLASRLEGRELLAAFGDNVFDVPMLRAARLPVLVEPKPRLVAYLETVAAQEAWAPVRLLIANPRATSDPPASGEP